MVLLGPHCRWCPYRHAHRLTPVPISARVRWGGSVGSICAAGRDPPAVGHRGGHIPLPRPRNEPSGPECLPVSSNARAPGAGLNPGYASLILLSKSRAAADMSTECRRFAPTHVAGGPSPAELVLSESTLAENTAFVPIKNEPTGGYGGAIFVARNVELTVQG